MRHNSAGLFDYLDQQTASALIAFLLSMLKWGGILALSNFHPHDPSECCKDCVADWQLVFRDESALIGLFPGDVTVQTERSVNRALVYAYVKT